MAEDIAPALLEAIRADFAKALAKLEAEAATWPQAYDYASEVGRALANALQAHLSGDTLPDGKLYWNIADRVVRPMLEQEHTLVAAVAAQVQQNLNEAAGLGLKAQTAALDSDRIDGILNMASNAEKYDTVAGQVSSAVENYSLHTVDETIRQNVEFQGGAGLKPRVIRKAAFGCCPWCTALAGTYTYPGVPKDVWRRHENCNCTVEYDPGDGRRQNVHTKQWSSTEPVKQSEQISKKSGEAFNFTEKYAAKSEADLLPNYNKASVPLEKLTDYALNMDHIKGRKKAIAFRDALGYTRNNAEQLRRALQDGLTKWKATPRNATQYGQPYEVRMILTGANGKQATVKTGWQIDSGSSEAHLISAYVYTEKGVTKK